MIARLRFPPSPSGSLAIGMARIGLYNYLHARRIGGRLILRIEDTDPERNRPGYGETIVRTLDWLGLGVDEGPVYQSARRERHVAAALDLVERERAYWSDPAPVGSRYDGRDRDRRLTCAPGRALRFRTPDTGLVCVSDLLRGSATFHNAAIEDFVLLRGTGDPLFLLATVIDDIDQGITHVVRGDEHLSNAPKYLMLWRALAAETEPPVFAHIPLLLNDQGRKLSSRREKVGVEAFQAEGYLPEALVDAMALCGWEPKDGDRRLGLPRLTEQFRLEDLSASPTHFDTRKLDALNRAWFRAMPARDFSAAAMPWLTDEVEEWPTPWRGRATFAADRWEALAASVQTRITRLADAPGLVDHLMLDAPDWNDGDWDEAVRQTVPHTVELLRQVADRWASVEWKGETIGDAVISVGAALGFAARKAQAPVRVAITGRAVGLPLWESVEALGRATALARIHTAIARVT